VTQETLLALMRARPGAQFTVSEGGTLADVVWLDDTIPPTPEEFATHLAADDKIEAWGRIKARRDYLSDTGGYMVTVNGVAKWFHSDQRSKTQQLGLVIAGAGLPLGLQWKTMDGSFVSMTQTLANQVYQAAMAQDSAIFQAAEQHRAAMEASANPLAYNFSGGWPAVFPGV
jgi:hypothetical protein